MAEVGGVADADDLHPGCLGGVDAGSGVLEDDAVRRGDPEGLGAQEEDLRVGLRRAGVGAVDDRIEVVDQADVPEDDPGVLGGGAKGGPDAGLAEGLEELLGAGEDLAGVHLFDRVDVPGVLLGGEGVEGGLVNGLVADLQEDLEGANPGDALQALVLLLGKVEAQLVGETAPGEVVVAGGVDNDPIEVKNAGFNLVHSIHHPLGWATGHGLM